MSEFKTPLYDVHTSLSAKMVPFAGWLMPLQYIGIISEHHAVRNSVGIFDVSHMAEIEIKGNQARDFCQKVTINNVAMLKPGRVQYSALLNEQGGIIDDCTVYCLADEHFMIVANAARRSEVRDWLFENTMLGVTIDDRSDDYGLLAVQGKKAEQLISKVIKRDLTGLNYYEMMWCEIDGVAVLLSRTGYTGEDGFELYLPAQKTEDVWMTLMGEGEIFNIAPVGLGARDTLRLEMGYLLSGVDFDQTTSPLEVNLNWITKLDKGSFVGRDAVVKLKESGITRRLRAFECIGKGIPRSGCNIFSDSSMSCKVGVVSSGTFSPTLKKGIALGIVDVEVKQNQSVFIEVRPGKSIESLVVKSPFVQGSIRK